MATSAVLPSKSDAASREPGAAQPPNKLAKAAQEFEAILLASWLEKMNQEFIGSEESQDPAHDTVSSLGTQAIASALAARGGIGIAGMLLRQLQPVAAQPTPASAMERNPLAGAQSAGSEQKPAED